MAFLPALCLNLFLVFLGFKQADLQYKFLN